MKNVSPLYLYFVSLICLVLANLMRDKNQFVYGAFLGAGVVIFLIGIYKKFSAK
jgi:hypothetical protein